MISFINKKEILQLQVFTNNFLNLMTFLLVLLSQTVRKKLFLSTKPSLRFTIIKQFRVKLGSMKTLLKYSFVTLRQVQTSKFKCGTLSQINSFSNYKNLAHRSKL